MAIYKGSQKQKEIFINNKRIKEIYKGNQLLYTINSESYPIDTVLFDSSTPGTYSLSVEAGIYEIYCIGAGGGGCGISGAVTGGRYLTSGGYSGAGFIGTVNLQKGELELVIGKGGAGKIISTAEFNGYNAEDGGQSRINNYIIAEGGPSAPIASTIKKDPANIIVNLQIQNETLKVNGNTCILDTINYTAPGAISVYNEYGKGGDGPAGIGNNGYIKIIYKGK